MFTRKKLEDGGGEGLPQSDGNIYHYYLSKLYHSKIRKIISANFVKIGS